MSAGIRAALAPSAISPRASPPTSRSASPAAAGAAVLLTREPSAHVLFGVAAVFAGLIASYALAVTTGLPLLHPEPEPVEALALFTKAVEAIGLVAAAHLLLVPTPRPRGALA